jgi:hypothetical protein
VQRHTILVAESNPKLNGAQMGGGFQVPVTLPATEREHIVIRHVFVIFLENGGGATSFTWH